MKRTTLLLALLLIATSLLLVGCGKTIEEIKSQEYVGEKVTVTGTVKHPVKIGGLSGYTLADDTETIGVSSENLPDEGEKVTVRGTVVKDTIFGYYIKE